MTHWFRFNSLGKYRFRVFAVVLIMVSCLFAEVAVGAQTFYGESGTTLFFYHKQSQSYEMHTIVSPPVVSPLFPKVEEGGMAGSPHMAAVNVGPAQFIVGLKNWSSDYFVHQVENDGEVGGQTDSGHWANIYKTFFGFHVGKRGFIFGQNDNTKYWFVQEVTATGKLGAETDTGRWHNYYDSATPLYVNGETYIFFQTKSSSNYWFIAHVSQDGVLHDVDDGYWGYHWTNVTSVNIDGNTYLFGERDTSYGLGKSAEWFIQRINSNGTMGVETDRGNWNNYYDNLVGYARDYNGANKMYIFGFNNGSTYYFEQEVTKGGTLGGETFNGHFNKNFDVVLAFNLFDSSGGFRYTIGWDLSKTTGAPTHSWSSLYADPWYGETLFGGGVALADIDNDPNHRYDAVLVGMENTITFNWQGLMKFYFKIAWNLDETGKPSSLSKVFYSLPYEVQNVAGGGEAIADINRNGAPDLLLMWIDDPPGANSFHYMLCFDMYMDGNDLRCNWSGYPHTAPRPLGWWNSGGGAAIGDIDKNGIPDLVMMGIDNPGGANKYWYTIGSNLDTEGSTTSWSKMQIAPIELGWDSAGGDVALADIDGNGKLDLVFMNINSPNGPNTFWCAVGWDVDINGNVRGWSTFKGPSPGWTTKGGGAAIADIDKNGTLDLLLMSIDNPFGD